MLTVSRRFVAQGVVEFGLGIAAVAFVAMVGFTALSGAQATYWGAAAPLLAAPVPQVGDFLHPTAIDVPVCAPALDPSNPIPVGNPITCAPPVVRDVYANINERKPPLGTVDWFLDGAPLTPPVTQPASPPCSNQPGAVPQVLPAATTGSTNVCPVGMTFRPTGLGMIGPHTLTVRYGQSSPASAAAPWEELLSNHAFSSSSVAFQITHNLQWSSPTCVNDVTSALPAMTAEVGHPLRCSVTLKDASSGTPVPVTTGTAITWSVSNSGSNGTAMFTCETTSASMPNPPCASPDGGSPLPMSGTASFVCGTDASGTCSVVYRRMYDNNGAGSTPAGPDTITLSADDIAPLALPVAVAAPLDSHSSGTVVACRNIDPPPHLVINSNNVTFGNVNFPAVTDLDINSAPQTTQLQCTANVFDSSANDNPAVNGSANPDKQEAYSPAGTVTFTFFNGTSTSTIGTCQLQRQDWSSSIPANPRQIRGQAPYLSTCGTGTFTISGSVNGPQEYIQATYAGEPVGGGATPGHQGSGYQFNVDFNP